MKHLKKLLCFIIAAVLLLPAPAIAVLADNSNAEAVENVEVVILFDVSHSMNNSDPENDYGARLSIQAAQQFVFNRPSEIDEYVTVIPYNSSIYDGFGKMNVSNESGSDDFVEAMDMILRDNTTVKDTPDDVIPGFSCWINKTDIGSALERATEILADSTCDKKAVILFTDGKIELSGEEQETASKNKAAASKETLDAAGIPIYSIGLNVSGDDVDKDFLNSVSGEKYTKIVTSASDLEGVFADIYEFLFPNSSGGNEGSFDISPDKVTDAKFRIYGEAVKEAKINLSSRAPLHTIKVTSPSGVVVADIDMNDPDNIKADIKNEYCVFQNDALGCIANITLLRPMDGDWTVSVSGEKSTVITRMISLFKMSVKTDIKEDTVFVGDSLKFTANLYDSENNTPLTSSSLYSKEDGASALVDVTRDDTGTSNLVSGNVTSAKDGYDFEVSFTTPGKYTLFLTLDHSQFTVRGERSITVVGPEMSISSAANADGGANPDIILTLKNPITGEPVSEIPQCLKGQTIKVNVMSGDTTADTVDVSADDFVSGAYTLAYSPKSTGTYNISASLSYGANSIETDTIEVTYNASSISMVGDITNKLSQSGLSASLNKEIPLDGVFTDSDGDSLAYRVEVTDGTPVTATIDGNVLKISATDFGKGTVRLIVSDTDEGALYAHEIKIEINSTMPLLITGIVIAVIVIVAGVVFLIIYNKQKVVPVAFRVRLEMTSPTDIYGGKKAVYSVVRMASKKNAKPNMTLSQIINTPNYATLDPASNMDAQDVSTFIGTYCTKITLCGIPFKKQFKITFAESDKKSKTYTFKSSNVSVKVGENATIVFGNRNAAL